MNCSDRDVRCVHSGLTGHRRTLQESSGKFLRLSARGKDLQPFGCGNAPRSRRGVTFADFSQNGLGDEKLELLPASPPFNRDLLVRRSH